MTNTNTVLPVDYDSFEKSCDGFDLLPEAKFWLVRNSKVDISTSKLDYDQAYIKLKEKSPAQIAIEEAARLAIIKYRDLFRATDDELHKSIPSSLNKLLVLDEWHHKDFIITEYENMSDSRLLSIYEFNKQLAGVGGLDFKTFASLAKMQEQRNEKHNKIQWRKNRPSSYETWRQLAKVLVTGDINDYQPSLSSNTHWSNWPESGSL